jgi:quinol monooxygenase YgiN
MVSFTVRLRFEKEDMEQVVSLFRQLTIASRQEPGCVTYVVHTVEDDPTTVLLYEQYKDATALEFHRNTPHFHQFAIGGFYQLMRDRQLENLIALG